MKISSSTVAAALEARAVLHHGKRAVVERCWLCSRGAAVAARVAPPGGEGEHRAAGGLATAAVVATVLTGEMGREPVLASPAAIMMGASLAAAKG